MPDFSLLTQLLALPNVRVTGYDLISGECLYVTIESTLDAAVCPSCQRISEATHGHAEQQLIRDLSIWQRQCWLRYRPRRFQCAHCQATFVERVLWREAEFVYTRRYEQALYERACREPISQIAQQEQLSEDIVQGLFERWAKKT
jgi:transposase